MAVLLSLRLRLLRREGHPTRRSSAGCGSRTGWRSEPAPPLPHLQSCSPLWALSPSPGKVTGSQPARRNAICREPTPAPVSEAGRSLTEAALTSSCPAPPSPRPCAGGGTLQRGGRLRSRTHLLQVLAGVTEGRDTAPSPSPHLSPSGRYLHTLKRLDLHALHLLLVSAPKVDTSLPSHREHVVPQGPALPCSRPLASS